MARTVEALAFSETGHASRPEPYAPQHSEFYKWWVDGLKLQPGVQLLLEEWDIGTDPDQFTGLDPYDDQQPVASKPIVAGPLLKRVGEERSRSPNAHHKSWQLHHLLCY